VKIVAVSSDPQEASAKMKGELGISFPLLSDEEEQVIKSYGLLHSDGNGDEDISRPATLLLDKQGVIRWAMFTDNIRVRAHPDALLKAAKELR
jgi:peroxiredoxin